MVAPGQPTHRGTPTPALQVGSRMVERFDGRATEFTIKLKPAELGQVNVRMEIGPDYQVRAVFAVREASAMDALVKDARTLEKMLAEAGLDVAEDGLRFEMDHRQSGGEAYARAEDMRQFLADGEAQTGAEPEGLETLQKPSSAIIQRWAGAHIAVIA